jgi:phosphohistidine swiveling domain-containing protein
VILPLGSGLAARRGCGAKAALLDRAARSKLPVPRGVVVLDEGWRFALDRRLVRIEGKGARRPISVPDPSLLLHLVGLPALEGPLAVRAAFSGGEGESEGSRPHAVSGLFVDGRRPSALAAGLAGVWSAAFDRPRRFRRDVIVQVMVQARQAGVAVTEPGYEDDVVRVTATPTGEPTAGPDAAASLLLPRRRGRERPTEAEPVAARLQTLLRDLRRVFGPGGWEVDWTDDGRRVWIIELRRLADPVPRNDAFTVASHRDILPDPPSRLMTSLVASCARGIFRRYRRLDSALPGNRPLVEVLHGRPLLNLSLLTEMVRRWGLPTRLVTDAIGGAADRDFGLQPRRVLRHARVLGRIAWSQLTSASSARHVEVEILERTATPPSRLAETLDELRWLYTVLAAEVLSLTAAMAMPLALLRRAGVLAEEAARWRSVGTEMLGELHQLRSQAAGRPEWQDALERGVVPEDPDLRNAVESWLERFGHRGVYESDISRPRYREAPELLLRSLTLPPREPPAPPRGSLGARLLRPVAWQAERSLRARESLRSAAMVGFERLRRALLGRARLFVADGTLPSVDALFDLDVGEVRELEAGFRPDETFWASRRGEIDAVRAGSVPDVVHRRDELETSPPGPPEGDAGTLVGIGLTRGGAEGRAWVLDEPLARLPEGFRPEETILVARAVDLGWLPVFALVSGVAVEIGGDLSYGSTVLREVGLPAVTNVRRLTHTVRTGDRLVLRADGGIVERVESLS